MTFKHVDDEWFVERMPKLELHAHLNGCIRPSTLMELSSSSEGNNHVVSGSFFPESRTLEGCFQLFDVLKTCVNSLAIVRRLTWEALQDFADQNVAYIELRSTPKTFSNSNKRQYIQTILDVMSEFEQKEMTEWNNNKHNQTPPHYYKRLPLIPRYIVSIDRSGTVQDAMEHVQLAMEFHTSSKYVVGIEFSGNPTKNHFRDFEPAFHLARQSSSLSISLHCGEIPCGQSSCETNETLKKAYEEATAMMNFQPDRLGHALFLPDIIWETLLHNNDDKTQKQIPIECCPTSNILTTMEDANTNTNDDMAICLKKQHSQLSVWIEKGYPFSINTDDPGIFDTNSTKEHLLLMKAFQLTAADLTKLVLQSIDHIFDTLETKTNMKNAIHQQLLILQSYKPCPP